MARKSKTPETSSTKIPRPRNAWIIYRAEQSRNLRSTVPGHGLTQQVVSQRLAEQWNNLPQELKDPYYEQAAVEKLEHEKRYPGYRFKPERGRGKGGRGKKATQLQSRESATTSTSANPSFQGDDQKAFGDIDNWMSDFVSLFGTNFDVLQQLDSPARWCPTGLDFNLSSDLLSVTPGPCMNSDEIPCVGGWNPSQLPAAGSSMSQSAQFHDEEGLQSLPPWLTFDDASQPQPSTSRANDDILWPEWLLASFPSQLEEGIENFC